MMNRIDRSMDGVHWVKTSKEPVFSGSVTTPAQEYDLVVVGGGYCGLSIALHAAKQGISVALLEAGVIGCGASGRNGGFTVPHFPGGMTTEDAYESIGKERAERLASLVAGGPSFVFDQIKEFEIQCDAEQVGWIQPAHSERALKKVKRVYESWRSRGTEVTWLNADEVHERTGAQGYIGGWYRNTGGTVNPYALAQGLARVAAQQGVHIFEGQNVIGFTKSAASTVVRTSKAEYRARKVVFATNAYTPDVHPGLVQSFIPVRLYHCLTRPLSEAELRKTLPSRSPFTDLRKSGGFARLDVEGRLVTGGAVFVAGDRSYGHRHATQRVSELFPHLKGIEIEHYWEGYCALTDAYLPAIQRLDKDIYSVIGFSTRGVALAQTLGKEMAHFLAESKQESEMPVRVGQVQEIFMQPIKSLIGGFVFPVYQACDRLGLT